VQTEGALSGNEMAGASGHFAFQNAHFILFFLP
jgi:hypothetical protein